MSQSNPFSERAPWDAVAVTGYAGGADLVGRPLAQHALEQLAPSMEDSVLDVATGPGTLALLLLDRVRKVTALDFSEPMLDQLRARAGQHPRLEVVAGDGQALPFEDDTYDQAFSMFGLMFFPDRKRGFGELLRTLKPGGRALVSSWAPISRSPLMQALFGALRAADSSRPEPQDDPLSLENPDVLAAEMQSGGFASVRVVPQTVEVPVDDLTAFWDVMVRSSAPIVMLRKRIGEDEWARQNDRAFRFLQAFVGSTPTTLATTAWFAMGEKPRA